ncbi:hypothetical protein ScPMuIL_011494 [Solemya velum]
MWIPTHVRSCYIKRIRLLLNMVTRVRDAHCMGIVSVVLLLVTTLTVKVAADLLVQGDGCSSDLDCNTTQGLSCTMSYVECLQAGTCECSTETAWIAGVSNCRPYVGKGVACEDDAECLDDMTCVSSICTCPASGSNVLACKTVTEMALGETCTAGDDATCFSNMVCPAGGDDTCKCPEYMFPDGADGSQICRKHYRDEVCTNHADCGGSHVKCSSGKCTCVEGYTVFSTFFEKSQGCKGDGGNEARHKCNADDEAGHDSCDGDLICGKCGPSAEWQCMTGIVTSSGSSTIGSTATAVGLSVLIKMCAKYLTMTII